MISRIPLRFYYARRFIKALILALWHFGFVAQLNELIVQPIKISLYLSALCLSLCVCVKFSGSTHNRCTWSLKILYTYRHPHGQLPRHFLPRHFSRKKIPRENYSLRTTFPANSHTSPVHRICRSFPLRLTILSAFQRTLNHSVST